MDLDTDSGTPPTHTTFGGSVVEQEPSQSSSRCQTESEGNILLQLLEFKSHLLEIVEELHIRRDAETRSEDQISKLVLEKQELEWEKESAQNKMERERNQHTEGLATVKKQFQVKLQSSEEEKGKYQVIAELKGKEINNLKEELKSLQLLKYNLEKKSSELEQKLALQSRTKDTHLNQLGEVEKRFSALSRQCATVKQAHEKLEQNVDEAMRINSKLTSANQKQEATIVSLQKELDEVSNRLIKVKMTSATHDKTLSPASSEQQVQELQLKLNMEIKMNRKLKDENAVERAEKQELVRSLQHTQQLLLSQTQIMRRAEEELQTQRDGYQALQHKHEVMQEKSKAMEEKVAQLMQDYTASRTSWDREKMMLLDQMKSQHKELRAVKEAFEDLLQKPADLPPQAKSQTQQTWEHEQVSSRVEDVRGGETLDEPVSSSEQTGLINTQRSVSQAKSSDCQEDTGAALKIAATRASGEEGTASHGQKSQIAEHILNHATTTSCPLTTVSLSSCDDSRLTSETQKLFNNPDTSESEGHIGSDIPEAHDGLQITVSCLSGTTAASNPPCGSLGGLAGSACTENYEKRNPELSESHQGREEDGKQKHIQVHDEVGPEQQHSGEFLDHVKDGNSGGAGGALVALTADTLEDMERSAKETGEISKHETETKDKADGEVIDGVKERGQTAEHTSDTQIPAQTDTTEKSVARQVSDFVDTQLPLTVCEPADFLQDPSRKVTEHASSNKACETDGEEQKVYSDDQRSVRQRPHTAPQEVPSRCLDEGQTLCPETDSDKQQSREISLSLEEPADEKKSKDKGDFTAEPSKIFKQLCSAQTLAAQSVSTTNVQEGGTGQTQTEICNPSDIPAITKLAPEPRSGSKESSAEGGGQPGSLLAGDGDGACKKKEGQSNMHTFDDNSGDTSQAAAPASPLKEAAIDDATFEVETRSCQRDKKTDKLEDTGDAETSRSECHVQAVEGTRIHDSREASLTSKKTYKSLFEWKKALSSRANVDFSASHQLTQGTSTTGADRIQGNQSYPISSYIQAKHNNGDGSAPLVMIRASDLLNVSSVSEAAASSRRQQRGQLEEKEEICRDAKAADTDEKASRTVSSFPASAVSSAGGLLSWQTSSWCSRAPSSAAGPSSELTWGPSSSQERDDEQASFRVQISKIQQFLNTDRLRLPKRPKIDN